MTETYTNPVYQGNFPDPFILRFNGRYYAYATDIAADGRAFPMLTSADLVHWEFRGGALEPLTIPGAELYWAPEVAYSEGRFYLYYATGRDANPDHHLRVAVAEHPLGPWRDAGVNLTPDEIFAIDAHPFRDPKTGDWYLYYARDWLTAPYAGTGIVADRLVEMDRLAGEPREVLRPFSDWQVFELKRAVKQGLDWYTIEGPFVVPVWGRYVCFYSGGRYEHPNYGVGYAVADHPLGPWVDQDNAAAPRVLTTIPGKIIGPGHNSVVLGPDLLTQYLVYHAWDPDLTARSLRLDPIEWDGIHPRCLGPSIEPRPVPRHPDIASHFDSADPGPEWEPYGQSAERTAEGVHFTAGGITLTEEVTDFAAETAVRVGSPETTWAVAIGDERITFAGGALHAGSASVPLAGSFGEGAWHRLSLVRRKGTLTAALDEFPTVNVPSPPGPVEVDLGGVGAVEFSHFVLTRLNAES